MLFLLTVTDARMRVCEKRANRCHKWIPINITIITTNYDNNAQTTTTTVTTTMTRLASFSFVYVYAFILVPILNFSFWIAYMHFSRSFSASVLDTLFWIQLKLKLQISSKTDARTQIKVWSVSIGVFGEWVTKNVLHNSNKTSKVSQNQRKVSGS